jgi:hypothetical protein
MKKILVIILAISYLQGFAQKKTGILLNKGQKITVVSTSTSDTDMGMGMQMKNVSSATNILNVIADEDKNYRISNTPVKLNLSMDMMGQQTSYDSEKSEDKDSEIGKEISQKMNVADTFLIEKSSGEVIKDKKDSPERPAKTETENPLEGIMGSSATAGDALLSGAFFIVPKEKKIGESWTDSTSEKNIKTVKTYTLKSIEKNIATILVTGTLTGNGETEMQGSSVAYNMTTKNTGEMIVDTKTNLVSKITNDGDITMVIEVMGQSMPITSKANSTIVYQY